MKWTCPECSNENNSELIQCTCGYRQSPKENKSVLNNSHSISEQPLKPALKLMTAAHQTVLKRDRLIHAGAAFGTVWLFSQVFGIIILLLVSSIFFADVPKNERVYVQNLTLLLTLLFFSPFFLAVCLGYLYGLGTKGLSYDLIFIEGFRRLFSFMWLAILNFILCIFFMLLLIIPGFIIYFNKYNLSVAVMVFENIKGLKALSRSRLLAQKHHFYLMKNYLLGAAYVLVIFIGLNLYISLFPAGLSLILSLPVVIGIIYSIAFSLSFYYLTYKELFLFFEKTTNEEE